MLNVGCVACKAVPAQKLPPGLLSARRADRDPIDFTKIQETPPTNYLLGPGDVLEIYIEGVLGSPEQPPPVHFSERSDTAPSLGFPVPVGEDGVVELPHIPAVPVAGLTVAQASQEIRRRYT